MLVCLVLGIPATAAAQLVRLHIDRVERGALRVNGLELILGLPPSAGIELRAKAVALELPDGQRIDNLQARCPRVTEHAGDLRCEDGSVQFSLPGMGLQHAGLALDYHRGGGALEIRLEHWKLGGGRVQVALRLRGTDWQADLAGAGLSLKVLQLLAPPLRRRLAGYSDVAGTFPKITLGAAGSGAQLRSARLAATVKDLNFNGENVAQKVSASLNLEVHRGVSAWRIGGRAALTAGAMFVTPGFKVGEIAPGFTIEASAKPISVALKGRWEPASGRLLLDDLDLVHPGVMRLQGSGVIAPKSPKPLRSLHLSVADGHLKQLYEVYLQPLLLGGDLGSLEVAGGVSGQATLSNDVLTDLRLRLHDVHADDQQGRFRLSGLEGDLALNSGPKPVSSRLTWKGAAIYKLNLGAGHLGMQSSKGDVHLVDWGDVPVLDGTLHIDKLSLKDVSSPSRVVSLSGVLTPVSLKELCQALGWPLMAGKVSGVVPGVTYSRGDLAVEGTLLVQAFDGDITVRKLRIAHLFGEVPELTADIKLNNLDLATLTRTFSFGKIEGKLSGSIDGLDMQSWQPVAFDAHFATPPGDDSRHRISQRAVNNLASLSGGGGATGLLSRGIMRFFDEFSYDRLGISCVLRDGVCHMSGIEPVDGGYYIVKRGLLPPWIDVKGFNRQVDWNVLVDRLKGIVHGQGPVIK